MKTMITLYENEHDELELGPFNQGVVVEDEGLSTIAIRDVATSNPIAFGTRLGSGHPLRWWAADSTLRTWSKVFVQPVAAEPEMPTIARGFGGRLFIAPANTPAPDSMFDIIDPETGEIRPPWQDVYAT